MQDALIAALLLLFIAAAVATIIWTRRRTAALIAGWAAAGGYQLLHSEVRYLRTGPYFLRHSRAQLICYVTVVDQQGRPRSAYLRLGSWILGLLSDQVDVSWED